MNKKTFLSVAFAVLSLSVNAQFGKLLDKAKSTVDKSQETLNKANELSNGNAKTLTDAATKKLKKASLFFSKSKFPSGAQAGVTDFQEGDNIYARIVFPQPIKEYLEEDGTLTFDVSYKQPGQDNYSVNYVKIDASKINKDAKLLDFDVLAKPSEATTLFADYMQAPSLIAMAMQNADSGQKTEFNWKVKDLEGAFTLKMKSIKTFADFIKPIQQKANSFQKDSEAMKAELPGEFAQKSYAFEDPQLSKANILKFLPANTEILKFVIGPGNDYKVMKNELGIILHKQTERYIMAAYKDKKSGNCFYDNMIFERPYEGNGKYGNLKLRTNGERIDCNKIK